MEYRSESPVLPAHWIDRLFMRLGMAYGREWMNKWEGFPMDAVKAEWAAQLGDLDEWQLAWALDHLPEFAPGLPKFRKLALEAPRKEQPALPQQTWTPPEQLSPAAQEAKKRLAQLCRLMRAESGLRRVA